MIFKVSTVRLWTLCDCIKILLRLQFVKIGRWSWILKWKRIISYCNLLGIVSYVQSAKFGSLFLHKGVYNRFQYSLQKKDVQKAENSKSMIILALKKSLARKSSVDAFWILKSTWRSLLLVHFKKNSKKSLGKRFEFF